MARAAGQPKIVDPTAYGDPDDTSGTDDDAQVEVDEDSRLAPGAALSADQLRIRELEHRLALAEGKKDVVGELETAAPGPDNIVIHFLEDGLTALGQIWMRGQELEFARGGQAYQDTKDRNGWSWLSLVDDEFGQVSKWGRIMFRRGPWPGKTYRDGTYEILGQVTGGGTVPAPTQAELSVAEEAERARRRAAPVLPKV
jgi:hypothetical protein